MLRPAAKPPVVSLKPEETRPPFITKYYAISRRENGNCVQRFDKVIIRDIVSLLRPRSWEEAFECPREEKRGQGVKALLPAKLH
jgi:hypothetical protein